MGLWGVEITGDIHVALHRLGGEGPGIAPLSSTVVLTREDRGVQGEVALEGPLGEVTDSKYRRVAPERQIDTAEVIYLSTENVAQILAALGILEL